jgi:hypothetical protein
MILFRWQALFNNLVNKTSELDYMEKVSPKNFTKEKRSEHRPAKLRNYRVEIKFVGKPIYQFRVINITAKGAGLLIKDDSAFLKMIEVGQILEADFISPEGTATAGLYKAEIKHITKLDKQDDSGHRLVGLSILEKIG